MLTVDSVVENVVEAVFHSKFILFTSEKYDWPLTNHQITIVKLAMAGNLISISVRYDKNIAKAFFAIVANRNWRISLFLVIIFQFTVCLPQLNGIIDSSMSLLKAAPVEIKKAPLPEKHQTLKDTLDSLVMKCLASSTNPVRMFFSKPGQ